MPFIRKVRVLCKTRLIFPRINGPIVTKNNVVGQLENFLRSLSSEVLERCTLTGSGLFELLNRDFEQIFWANRLYMS